MSIKRWELDELEDWTDYLWLTVFICLVAGFIIWMIS